MSKCVFVCVYICVCPYICLCLRLYIITSIDWPGFALWSQLNHHRSIRSIWSHSKKYYFLLFLTYIFCYCFSGYCLWTIAVIFGSDKYLFLVTAVTFVCCVVNAAIVANAVGVLTGRKEEGIKPIQ